MESRISRRLADLVHVLERFFTPNESCRDQYHWKATVWREDIEETDEDFEDPLNLLFLPWPAAYGRFEAFRALSTPRPVELLVESSDEMFEIEQVVQELIFSTDRYPSISPIKRIRFLIDALLQQQWCSLVWFPDGNSIKQFPGLEVELRPKVKRQHSDQIVVCGVFASMDEGLLENLKAAESSPDIRALADWEGGEWSWDWQQAELDSWFARQRQDHFEEETGDTQSNNADRLTAKERTILEAVKEKPMRGEAISRKVDATWNSSFRDRLSQLVKRGQLAKVRSGYTIGPAASLEE